VGHIAAAANILDTVPETVLDAQARSF